jgi:MFS family permease
MRTAFFVVVVKILSGLFEGAIYPSVNAVLAQWTPDKDRTSTACYVYTGAPIGVIMAIILTNSVAIVTRHWPSVFYFFGSVLVIFVWSLENCLHIPLRKSTLASPTKNEITLRRNWVGRECVSFSLHYRYFCRGKMLFLVGSQYHGRISHGLVHCGH